jgi:5-methylcytosine-specific restriction endonuclease McrA
MARRRKAQTSGINIPFYLLFGAAIILYGVLSLPEGSDLALGAGGIVASLALACAAFTWWRPRLAWRLLKGSWRAARARFTRSSAIKSSVTATSRQPIPAGLRFAVLRRDGFRCVYCGRGEPDGIKLHLDHLVPVVRGGRNELDNLVTACADCNLGKSASDLVGDDAAEPELVMLLGAAPEVSSPEGPPSHVHGRPAR